MSMAKATKHQKANRRNKKCQKQSEDISPENCKDCHKEIMDCPIHSVSMPSPLADDFEIEAIK